MVASVEDVRDETVGEFRLKPGRFGRHDLARIGNRHQFVHLGREHGKCDCHFAAIHPALKFRQATNATDEIDAFVAAQIGDPENRSENLFGEHRNVEAAYRVGGGD